MSDTIPQPPPDGITPELRAWMVQTVRQADVSDSLDWELEKRVAAIEEVLAARWPRRLVAALRLGRSLRASVAPWRREEMFVYQRAEAVTNAWLIAGSTRRDGAA